MLGFLLHPVGPCGYNVRMIQTLAKALNGTVHGDVLMVGDFIITCTMTGTVKATHRSQPGTHRLGTMNDSVGDLASEFEAFSFLYV